MKWLKKEKTKLRRGYGTYFQKYSKFLIATEAVNTLSEKNITHLLKRCHFNGLKFSPLANSKSNYEMKQVCTVLLLGVWAENT